MMMISRKRVLFSAGIAAAGVLFAAPAADATRPPSLTISPSQAQSGNAVTATVYCVGGLTPSGPVTSTGFAAPIAVHGSSASEYSGQGKAGTKAGEFTASVQCPGPSGTVVTAHFTVTPGNPPTRPTTPSAPTTKPKPQAKSQVSAVPAGGVETGGGATAP
jgi:hypothetical protein